VEKSMMLECVELCHEAKPASNPAPELAVILPTYNERENVAEMLRRLHLALAGLCWQVCFVDDNSPDGTAAEVARLAATDSHVRLLKRIGRRGLSSACIEGILAAEAPVVAVMDADLQHDESALPRMLAKLRADRLELVVATRMAEGGSMGRFSILRQCISKAGRWMSRSVSGCPVSDPMSGFFMVRRDWFVDLAPWLDGSGFKILLDILCSAEKSIRIGEVGYCFRLRQFGESKFDWRIGLEYLSMLRRKAERKKQMERQVALCLPNK